MSFLGLMTVRAHEAVTREWDLRCIHLMEQRDGETIRANKLAAEIAALRPDAQKWRDRKKADREYRAEKRAKVGEGVS